MDKRLLTALLSGLGALIGMVAWHCWPTPAPLTPWQKVEVRLNEADQAANQSADQHLNRVRDFFRDKQSASRRFAEDALSWSGKWAYCQGLANDGASHRSFLRESFERHVMKGPELEELVQQVVTAYLSELQGQENAMLVAIRADLSTDELPSLAGMEMKGSDEAFNTAYQSMLEQVKPLLLHDLEVTFGREAAVWIGSDIATVALVDIANGVAIKMGISGSILGAGAASSVATLGIGLIVGLIVEEIVDFILQKAGYDPVGNVQRQVNQTLDNLANSLIDTLRPKLNGIAGARSQLRAAALKKLVLAEGGVQ